MGLRKQLGVVGGCFRTLFTHPFSLIYPVLTAVSIVGLLLGFGALALFMGTPVGPDLPSSTVIWGVFLVTVVATAFVGMPLLITTLKVAYCYEIHELYQGRRPMPGSGLAVALRSLKRIVLGTLIVAGVFNSGRAVGGAGGQVGAAAGSATVAGSHVLATFMAPAIAIEDAGAKATAQYIKEAVGKQWGQAFVASYGVSKIAGALFVVGLAAGVGIVASVFLGAFPLAMEPGRALVLGVLSPFAGFFAAAMLKATVDGPVSTALYVYAVDGETPDRIGLSVDDLAKLN